MTSLRVICGLGPPPNQKSWLRLWSGLLEIFCAIQKRGFLTCILCRKLPSKLELYQKFQVNSLLSFRVKHFYAAATELLATMSNLLLLQANVFSDAQKNVHLLSTSKYLVCLKYNSNFACNLAENCRLQLCAFLTSYSQKKTYTFMFLRQILSCYNLKNFFSKLVKVLVLELFYGTRTRVHFSISVLVLELFYGTRTRVHFSISVLVLEVFCGTRTRKLSTRLHH